MPHSDTHKFIPYPNGRGSCVRCGKAESNPIHEEKKA